MKFGYRSVAEMLSDKDAAELSELSGYEKAYGPLDNTYERERLADMTDLLQLIYDVLLKANGQKKGHKFVEVERVHDLLRQDSKRAAIPQKSEEQIKEEQDRFYKSLEEKNRKRGYEATPEYIAKRMAERQNKRTNRKGR